MIGIDKCRAFGDLSNCQVELGNVDYLQDRPGKTGTDRDQRSGRRLYLD